jgi:hypothetical protein
MARAGEQHMDAMHIDTFVDRQGVFHSITCMTHPTGGLMLHYKLVTEDAGQTVKKVLHSLIQTGTYDEAHLEREKLKARICE